MHTQIVLCKSYLQELVKIKPGPSTHPHTLDEVCLNGVNFVVVFNLIHIVKSCQYHEWGERIISYEPNSHISTIKAMNNMQPKVH